MLVGLLVKLYAFLHKRVLHWLIHTLISIYQNLNSLLRVCRLRLSLREWWITNNSVLTLQSSKSSKIYEDAVFLFQSFSNDRDNSTNNCLNNLGVNLDQLPNCGVVKNNRWIFLMELRIFELDLVEGCEGFSQIQVYDVLLVNCLWVTKLCKLWNAYGSTHVNLRFRPFHKGIPNLRIRLFAN